MRRITYALTAMGHVVSRVDSEVAWPILDYEAIGKDGDFTKPLTYKLEKFSVLLVGPEWQTLIWTRKIPVEQKNIHRKFWGFQPLKE